MVFVPFDLALNSASNGIIIFAVVAIRLTFAVPPKKQENFSLFLRGRVLIEDFKSCYYNSERNGLILLVYPTSFIIE